MNIFASCTQRQPLPCGVVQLLPVTDELRKIQVLQGGAKTTKPPLRVFQTSDRVWFMGIWIIKHITSNSSYGSLSSFWVPARGSSQDSYKANSPEEVMVLRINHLSCVAHYKLISSRCTMHACIFNYISYPISPIYSNQISPRYPAKAHQILSQPIQPCAYHVIGFHSRCILQPELKDRCEYGVDCGTIQWVCHTEHHQNRSRIYDANR